MRRIAFYILCVLVFFILQTSACRIAVPITDVYPNLLLVFAISFGLLRGEKTGLLLGFFSGILMDILFMDRLGFYALLLMFVGFLTGLFCRVVSAGSFLPTFALIIAGDFLYGFGVYVFQFLLRSRFHFRFYLLHIILPEMALTFLTALVLVPLFYLVNERMEIAEERRSRKFV